MYPIGRITFEELSHLHRCKRRGSADQCVNVVFDTTYLLTPARTGRCMPSAVVEWAAWDASIARAGETRQFNRVYGAETRAARRYDRTEHGRPYDDPLLFY